MIDADRRAKTVMATSTHVELGVLDHRVLLRRHALERSGAVLFSLGEVPPRCALRVAPGADLPVLDLVAVDVSCAHRADRVRGIVRMTGRSTCISDRSATTWPSTSRCPTARPWGA